MANNPPSSEWRVQGYLDTLNESVNLRRDYRQRTSVVRDRFERQEGGASVPALSIKEWRRRIDHEFSCAEQELETAEAELKSVKAETDVALRASTLTGQPVDEEVVAALVDALQLDGVYTAVRNRLPALPIPKLWESAASSCTKLSNVVETDLKPRTASLEVGLSGIRESMSKVSLTIDSVRPELLKLDNLSAEVDRLEKVEREHFSLEKKFNVLQKAYSSVTASNSSLKNELSELRDEKSNLEKERDAADSRFLKMSEERDNADRERYKLDQTSRHLQAELESAKDSARRASEENQNLSGGFVSPAQRIAALERLLDRSRRLSDDHGSRAAGYKASYENSQRAYHILSGSNDRLRKKLEFAGQQHEEMEQALRVVGWQFVDLQGECRRLSADKEVLGRRLAHARTARQGDLQVVGDEIIAIRYEMEWQQALHDFRVRQDTHVMCDQHAEVVRLCRRTNSLLDWIRAERHERNRLGMLMNVQGLKYRVIETRLNTSSSGNEVLTDLVQSQHRQIQLFSSRVDNMSRAVLSACVESSLQKNEKEDARFDEAVAVGQLRNELTRSHGLHQTVTELQRLRKRDRDTISKHEADFRATKSRCDRSEAQLTETSASRALVLQILTGLFGVPPDSAKEDCFGDILSSYQVLGSAVLVSPAMSTLSIQGQAQSHAQPSLLLQLCLRGGRLALEDVDAIAASLCGTSSALLSILVALIKKRARTTESFSVSSALVICRCLEVLCLSQIPLAMIQDIWASVEPLVSSARLASLLVEAAADWVEGVIGGVASTLAASLIKSAAKRGQSVDLGDLVLMPLTPDIICVIGDSVHVVRRENLSYPSDRAYVSLLMQDIPYHGHPQRIDWVADSDAWRDLALILGSDYANVGESVEHPSYCDEH